LIATMGGSQSSPIPGGGTEGYHVLRVCVSSTFVWTNWRRSRSTRL